MFCEHPILCLNDYKKYKSLFKKFINRHELVFNLIMALLLVYTSISILYV